MDVNNKNQTEVLRHLREILPPDCLITDGAGLRPYETDGLTAIREMPWVVVLPETEAQVVEIMAICRDQGVPVIPRGAGTGLSGGARPHKDGVVMGLSKMNKILHIDPDNRVARVQPGCVTWLFLPRPNPMACTTRQILPPRLHAVLAVMLRRMQVGCIA